MAGGSSSSNHKPRRAALGLALAGLTCVALGVVVVLVAPWLIKDQVSKHLVLKPDTIIFKMWKDIPVPFYFSVYMFEVLNSKDVLKGAKPELAQRGPFVYRENRSKRNITFNENGTVSFLEQKWFHFCPDLSNGSEQDYVVVPNLLVLGAAMMLADQSFAMKMMVSAALATFQQTAFINRTVSDILWGYKDPFLDFVNAVKPGLLPFKDKFGLLVQLNNSNSGMFTVYTGTDDLSKVHKMDNWNGLTKLPFWNSDQCNMINGTSGQMWPPFMTSSTPVEFYSPDACRSMKLEYTHAGNFEGIPIYRYKFPKTLFANGTDYPPNEGFCPCRQSGILNVSKCQQGAPMFISNPHFFNADPSLLEGVGGLRPNESAHETLIDLNPLTGIPMSCTVKLQLNIFTKQVTGIIQTGRIKPVVLPVIWFEETGKIDGDLLSEFYTFVVMIPLLVEYGQYCFLALGGVFLVVATLLALKSMTPVLEWQGPVAIRTLSVTKFLNRGQLQKYQGPQGKSFFFLWRSNKGEDPKEAIEASKRKEILKEIRLDAQQEGLLPKPDQWNRPPQHSGLDTAPLLQEGSNTANHT
ncbi:scavenger receptor class B member 1 [Tiliqua scincoides]|uniref:scavenger receptor class B member 1 n=1 Tax=Tiliqua scincoides TaxID=71010 RepID=UPI003462E8D6